MGPRAAGLRLQQGGETCAVLDLVDLPDGDTQQHSLHRIGAMLPVHTQPLTQPA